VDPDVNNLELTKKTSTRLLSLIKYGGDPTVELKIIDEAVENLKEGRSVLQSLKIIRKIGTIKEGSSKVQEYVAEKGVLKYIFENLRKFKAGIREKIEKAGLDVTSINETTVNQFLPNKNYTFEENILKRLRFVDFSKNPANLVIYSLKQDKEKILSIITQIWDELIANSLTEKETLYFKKWFVKFSSKESDQVLDKEVMSEFFFDKIKILETKGHASTKEQLLNIFTEIFIRINILTNKLSEQVLKLEDNYRSTYADLGNVSQFIPLASPEDMDGIDCLWNVALRTDDDKLAEELTEFLTKLYVRPETEPSSKSPVYREYTAKFFQRCTSSLQTIMESENWSQDPEKLNGCQRIIEFLGNLVDQTEWMYPVKNISLSSFYVGDLVSLSFENKINSSYEAPKKLELKVHANTTIIELKKQIASHLKRITWKNVKLVRAANRPEIKDKHNSRNLRDMRIKLGEKLTCESRPIIQKKIETEKLRDNNNVMTEKCDKVIREVYHRFEHDGKMGPAEIAKFAQIVLDQNSIAPDDNRVKEMIEKWDLDKDGLLSEEEFWNFYENATIHKPNVVWQNLKSLNYGNDLCFLCEEEYFSEDDLARFYIMTNEEFLNTIFGFLDRSDNLGKIAWDFLSRIPPIPKVIRKITKLEGLDADKLNNWDEVIENTSVYKTMYYMYILEYLLEQKSTEDNDLLADHIEGNLQEFRSEWRNEFIKKGGFLHLLKILSQYIQKGINTRMETMLFSFIMKSVKSYILASATIENPAIYRNIAYINSTTIPIHLLTGKKASKEYKRQQEILKIITRKLKAESTGIFPSIRTIHDRTQATRAG
jgi:hypothetical protein